MTECVRFVFDGQVRELRDVDPTMTVLNYLRTVEHLTGTKEGCAEGDCGACTVVLGRLTGDHIAYRAVNSCILFLPTIDGKQLIPVEHLATPRGDLHLVQQALVDCHGSQCGFCTPGFVMSLFALHHAQTDASREQINDVFAGNLCRCTGYRPIVAAAQQVLDTHVVDRFDKTQSESIALLRAIKRTDTLQLHHGDKRYFAPTTVDNLAELLDEHHDATLLAGGTDLGLRVTKQHQDLDTLIYTGDITELNQIRETPTHVELGAAASYSDCLSIIGKHYPDFGELLRRLGSVQIRNLGTMAGNLATASPIGDSIPPLIAVGATVTLRHRAEQREVPLDEFFVGYRQTVMAPGEFIERIRIPIRRDRFRLGVYKISKRFDQDISSVCAAFGLELNDGQVTYIRICYGGMAETPKRASACERALLGSRWTSESIETASDMLDIDFSPITDMRAGSDYRRLVTRNLLLKFFLETTDPRLETRVLEYQVGADG